VIGAARTPGQKALLVGDGSSDLAAAGAVNLFCGFGGVVARPMVAAQSPAFIASASIAPVLLLALRESEGEHLAAKQRARQVVAEQPDALRKLRA
jgi:hypothetical protein